MALALFKLALALHTALRFGEANEAYGPRVRRSGRRPPAGAQRALACGSAELPASDPTALAGRTSSSAMALFDRLVEAWPERTIVPSLAERWEIPDDGLRYVFHLREGSRGPTACR